MPNNIVVSHNLKKAQRVLQNIEKEKAYEFAEILKQAYKANPEKKDLEELEKWLDQYPEIWRLVFDMSQVIEKNLISQLVSEKAVHLAIEKNVDDIRLDLGYEDAVTMERMLIDNIVLSWLRCQAAEFRLVLFMGQNSVSTSTIGFWE